MCASMRFTASFMAWPAPTPPTWWTERASAAKIGRARSTSTRSPPAMTMSVPSSAGLRLPRTGASMKLAPRAAASSAARRADGTPSVPMSMRRAFSRRAPATPVGPSRTSTNASGLPTIMMTTSAAAAATRGVEARRAPPAVRGAARDGVRLKTRRGNPARRRFEAIGAPIVPRPIQAISGFMSASLRDRYGERGIGSIGAVAESHGERLSARSPTRPGLARPDDQSRTGRGIRQRAVAGSAAVEPGDLSRSRRSAPAGGSPLDRRGGGGA